MSRHQSGPSTEFSNRFELAKFGYHVRCTVGPGMRWNVDRNRLQAVVIFLWDIGASDPDFRERRVARPRGTRAQGREEKV